MKGEFIMKTNMINTNSVIKSICAVVMLLGISVSAWGVQTGTLTMNSSVSSGTKNNGVTFEWTSANIAVNTTNNGFKNSSSMTITIPSGTMLTGISKVNGNTWGGSAKISVYAGSNNSGTKLVDIVTGTNSYTISSNNTGITYFFENASGGNAWINSLSISYANASPCYVLYDPAGGSCATEDDTEESAGAGVVLPAATPSASMASMGWGFYGWAEDAVDDLTTTTPTIVGKAGDTYYPDEDVILTAVYAKGEYTKIMSTSDINSTGKYIFAAVYSSKNYVMTSKYASQKLAAEQIDETSSGKYAAALMNASWCFTLEANSSYWHIKDCNSANTDHYLDTYYTEWYGHAKDNADPYTFTWSTDHWTIQNKYSSGNRYFGYSNSDEAFKTYSTAQALQIYKETKTPTYCSSPSTVKLVASPSVGGTVVFNSNSKDEMDFKTDDGLTDIGITATPTSGYEFVNWVSSDEDVAVVDDYGDPTTDVTATESATLTAYFYKNCSVTYTLTGFTKTSGPTNIDYATNTAGFTATFSMQDHYRTTPITCSVTMGGETLTEGSGNDYTWNASTKTLTFPAATDITGDLVVTISAEHTEYTKYAFSCADLTLTPKLVTEGTPIFITSTAGKTVRSQDSILIVGSGLTPSTKLTYPDLPSKFAIKSRAGDDLQTDGSGEINAVAYIYYTPGSGDTSDGLDKLTGISVSVSGAKPITKNLTQDIIGRHLPADFVIAVKKNGKWYALPDTMTSTRNPQPIEIAVDDYNNPSIAYTANTNIYNLYGQVSETIGGQAGYLYTNGETVKFGMKNNTSYANYPLFASSTGTTTLGKGGSATSVTNNIGSQYWWTLKQFATDITNPQDAKYYLRSSNNAKALRIKDNPAQWGLYSSGDSIVRLIPASDIPFTEASVVEWGQHSAIVEVDATGIDATSVVAYLDEATSSAIELVQTKSSVKNGNTKYNYTVNFGDGIDFADAASNGAMLTLEWKKSETVKAMSNIIVPKIIAASATMSSLMATDAPWSTAEVHVLPGVTLEANAGDFSSKDVVINQLEIYPGATIKVTKGSQDVGTLKVKTLVLRNGWTRVGSKSYDVARLYVPTDANLQKSAVGDVWYSDWYIDYDQYYPIAVPFPVATSSIIYKNSNSAASAGVTLRYYSGELRAANIQQNQDANWVGYTWGGTMPTNLEPSHGYIMTAKRPTGKAFSIVRMPMTFSNEWAALGEKGVVGETHKDTVYVKAWGDENTPTYAKGWNIIANPYMSLHQGALSYDDESGDEIEFANIPDINFKEYDQLPIDATKLKPSSAFLVQAPKDGTVTFGTANRKASAPSYRQEIQAETYPRQKAYIVLANEDAEDMMGIWISEKYSAEYEINADLEKLLSDGKSLRTYMHWNEMKMAYVALNKELAQQWIPVSVRIETEGEHTFSMHSASVVGELKSVYLTDYMTGQVTNLLEDSYSFYSTAGTIHERFAINAIVGPRDLPTELDIVRDGNDGTGPIKFIYHDKVFILHEGVIYDSTGKKVSGK